MKKAPVETGAFALELFSHCQHQDTDDDHGDEGVGLPGELLLQEDPGEHQGHHTHGGQDGSRHRIHAAQGVDTTPITSGDRFSLVYTIG